MTASGPIRKSRSSSHSMSFRNRELSLSIIRICPKAGSNPSPEVLKLLKEKLGDAGSIVSYNAAFEKGVLNQAVDSLSRIRGRGGTRPSSGSSICWRRSAPSRSIIPRKPGSASLKAVLPALTGAGYESLDIADGEAASREYLRVTFGSADAAERAARPKAARGVLRPGYDGDDPHRRGAAGARRLPRLDFPRRPGL